VKKGVYISYTQLGFFEVRRLDLLEIQKPFVTKLLNTSAGKEWWIGGAPSYYSPNYYSDISKIYNDA